ncbi:MAG: hypothetical protein ACRYG7_09030 [Janthinobacterium lividum]
MPPLPFPDLSLVVPYPEALSYAQHRLKMLGSGEAKPFCVAHGLPYSTIINLKNGRLPKEQPRLLQKLLASLDVRAELIRFPPERPLPQFLLPDATELATFRQQLAYFKSIQ